MGSRNLESIIEISSIEVNSPKLIYFLVTILNRAYNYLRKELYTKSIVACDFNFCNLVVFTINGWITRENIIDGFSSYWTTSIIAQKVQLNRHEIGLDYWMAQCWSNYLGKMIIRIVKRNFLILRLLYLSGKRLRYINKNTVVFVDL